MAVIVGTLANEILAGINFDDTNFVFGDSNGGLFNQTGGNDTVSGGKRSENHLYGDAAALKLNRWQ